MSRKKIVIALGHKDLGVNLPQQYQAVRKTAAMIAQFVQDGYQVAIVFSNAPQVGMIHTAMQDLAERYPQQYTRTPLSVCAAMSQGLVGYDLQNAIRSELLKRGMFRTVSTILTQVLVDPYDESFYQPVKLVGKVMNQEQARSEEESGNEVAEQDDGRYRRIVPAPIPRSIVEIDAIRALLDADQIVIAAGGGGIPVMQQGMELKGAAAVIEKDLAAGLLAREVDADYLLITTAVEQVSLHFGTEQAQPIRRMSARQAREYIKEGHFEFRSMQPKIEASAAFVESDRGRAAIITTMEMAVKALAGEAGTRIL